ISTQPKGELFWYCLKSSVGKARYCVWPGATLSQPFPRRQGLARRSPLRPRSDFRRLQPSHQRTEMVSSGSATLVGGGNGFLGSLVAASLLAEEKRRLLLPVRSGTKVVDCTAKLRAGLEDYGISEPDADELLRLATIIELPALENLEALDQVAKSMEV